MPALSRWATARTAQKFADDGARWEARALPGGDGYRLVAITSLTTGEVVKVVKPVNGDKALRFATLDAAHDWLQRYAGTTRFCLEEDATDRQ